MKLVTGKNSWCSQSFQGFVFLVQIETNGHICHDVRTCVCLSVTCVCVYSGKKMFKLINCFECVCFVFENCLIHLTVDERKVACLFSFGERSRESESFEKFSDR